MPFDAPPRATMPVKRASSGQRRRGSNHKSPPIRDDDEDEDSGQLAQVIPLGATHPKDLDVPDATSAAEFACPGLTTFCGLDDLGLEVTGQRLEGDRAVLVCRVVEPAGWCQRCGCEGVPRDTALRPLAHEPFGWRPTTLLVTLRRYRCAGCGHVWRQDASKAVEPRRSSLGGPCGGH